MIEEGRLEQRQVTKRYIENQVTKRYIENKDDLIKACRTADIQKVKMMLIDQPSLVTIKGIVRAAVEGCNVELIRFLLRQGADWSDWEYDDSENYYNSSIVTACKIGLVDIVRVLIEEGADINKAEHEGETPLGIAACYKKFEVCKLLIENGANPLYKNKNGITSIHWAAQGGDVQIIRFLLPFFENISETDNYGFTPLHNAVFLRVNTEPALEFLKKGADINAVNHNGDTPLHLAAYAGAPEIVRVLIEFGANINLMNFSNNTPLDSAFAARRLLSNHNRKDKYDEVIKFLKISGGKYNILRRLFG